MSRSELEELLKQQKELNKKIKEAKRQEEMSNVESLIEDVKKSDEYVLIADIAKGFDIIYDKNRIRLVAKFNDTNYETKFFNKETMSNELELLKSKCIFFDNVKQIANESTNNIYDIPHVDYGIYSRKSDYDDIQFIFYKKQIRVSIEHEKYSEILLINGYTAYKQYQANDYGYNESYVTKELIVDLDCDLTESLSQEKIDELTTLVKEMEKEILK